MTALNFFNRRCEVRGQLHGRTVIDPDDRAGIIVDSEWVEDGTEDGCLTLRLCPPGMPKPSWVRADGSEIAPAWPGGPRIASAAVLASGREINGEHCWRVPASDCRMVEPHSVVGSTR